MPCTTQIRQRRFKMNGALCLGPAVCHVLTQAVLFLQVSAAAMSIVHEACACVQICAPGAAARRGCLPQWGGKGFRPPPLFCPLQVAAPAGVRPVSGLAGFHGLCHTTGGASCLLPFPDSHHSLLPSEKAPAQPYCGSCLATDPWHVNGPLLFPGAALAAI